jgi:hypothetical protein
VRMCLFDWFWIAWRNCAEKSISCALFCTGFYIDYGEVNILEPPLSTNADSLRVC